MGSEDNKLHAVNASDGAQIWVGDYQSVPPPRPDGNTIYVGDVGGAGASGAMTGSSRSPGRRRRDAWAFSATNVMWAAPTVSANGSTVCATTGPNPTGGVSKIRRERGNRRRTVVL